MTVKVRSQKYEVRSQKYEVRSQKDEVRSRDPRAGPFVLQTSYFVLSKEKVPLREREDIGRLRRQHLPVGADLVGLRIHLDLRQRVVHHQIRLRQPAA